MQIQPILGLYQPISPNFDTQPPLFANPGSSPAWWIQISKLSNFADFVWCCIICNVFSGNSTRKHERATLFPQSTLLDISRLSRENINTLFGYCWWYSAEQITKLSNLHLILDQMFGICHVFPLIKKEQNRKRDMLYSQIIQSYLEKVSKPSRDVIGYVKHQEMPWGGREFNFFW